MSSTASSQLLSDQLWRRVREIDRGDQSVMAAFAYFSQDHLNLQKGDVLIVDASDGNVRSCSIDAGLLNTLHERGVLVHTFPGLHAKVVRIGDYAVVGSANSSINSEKRLTEAAIVTSDPLLTTQVVSFLEQLQAKATRLMSIDIRKLMRIKPNPKDRSPSTLPMKFVTAPRTWWWLGVGPLSARIILREEEDLKRGLEEAAILSSNSATKLDYIRWGAKAPITQRFRVGDMVFRAYSTPWGNNKNTRVSCPAIIVNIQRKDRWIRLYLADLSSYRGEASLRQVQAALSTLGRRTLTAKSARALSADETEELRDLLGSAG